MTVLGPVDAAELGVVLPHEHLLLDLTCLWHPPLHPWQAPLVDAPPTAETRADLMGDPYVSRANLRLDEPGETVEELRAFREAGGGAVVDLTVTGLHPRPAALREISRRSGVHVIVGCGFYIQQTHPQFLASASEDALAERLVEEIAGGLEGGVRPGIIGEIGTSSTIHGDERKVLRVAARAQRRTGLAVNVHVSLFTPTALEVLEVLDAAGADLSRVVISHLDELLDSDYHRAVLKRGAYVELDTFGSEMHFADRGQGEPSDAQRIEALLRLLDEGWTDRLLLSQDVCTKLHLRRYGGFGYAHILCTIVPELERRGVDAGTLKTLLIDNPARVLAHQPLQ